MKRKEDELLKWHRKNQAKKQEKRTKAAVCKELTASPSINDVSRSLAVNSNSEMQEYAVYRFDMVASNLRKWASLESTDSNNNLTLSLKNFKLSNSKCSNFDTSASPKNSILETSCGIPYSSIYRSLCENQKAAKSEASKTTKTISQTSPRLSFSSGFNSEEFMARAKPLVSYRAFKR